MNAEDKTRIAAGESEQLPPAPHGLNEADAVRKDMSYSPGSESETAQKQSDTIADTVDDDIDADQVQVAPGTGGPDDVGEIEVDPDDLNMPGRP